jgi:hypothetical protein
LLGFSFFKHFLPFALVAVSKQRHKKISGSSSSKTDGAFTSYYKNQIVNLTNDDNIFFLLYLGSHTMFFLFQSSHSSSSSFNMFFESFESSSLNKRLLTIAFLMCITAQLFVSSVLYIVTLALVEMDDDPIISLYGLPMRSRRVA